jgi:hypothetical protein
MDAGIDAALRNLRRAIEKRLLLVRKDRAEHDGEGIRTHRMAAGVAETGHGEERLHLVGMCLVGTRSFVFVFSRFVDALRRGEDILHQRHERGVFADISAVNRFEQRVVELLVALALGDDRFVPILLRLEHLGEVGLVRVGAGCGRSRYAIDQRLFLVFAQQRFPLVLRVGNAGNENEAKSELNERFHEQREDWI